MISRIDSLSCSSKCILPPCQSNEATCPFRPPISICLDQGEAVSIIGPKKRDRYAVNSAVQSTTNATEMSRQSEEMLDAPSIPCISTPIWTPIECPLSPHTGSSFPNAFHNIILVHPPSFLHSAFIIHHNKSSIGGARIQEQLIGFLS